ncbi:ATP-binding protein [Chelatococcus sp. GCM10030263]|uniref:ATP-binding protein n=1 Tax=Chelatococcus sp. GCM10030263 TaxID=3273387 RepID=UPI003610A390
MEAYRPQPPRPPNADGGGAATPASGRRVLFGLSARLLVLTVLFGMFAEIMIYVPSIASFRMAWLSDRLATAQVAGLVLEAAPEGGINRKLEEKLLAGVGAQAIAVKVGGARHLLALADTPAEVAETIDLRDPTWATLIGDAFRTLLVVDNQPVRVVGAGMGSAAFVEMIIDQRPLRAAMISFSKRILLVSLLISTITAGLVYLALQLLIVRPVRRFSANVAAFASDPEDASRIIVPSGRNDEIGVAERALAEMEHGLADVLRQKKHLAALGLAVSKINHDLRNMLAAAQLLSDRLAQLADPSIARFAPRLVATLGRAIDFCQATLAYGGAAEPVPERRRFLLAPLVEEMRDLLIAEDDAVTFDIEIAPDLMVDADPEHLSRILLNLCRNAIQALAHAPERPGGQGQLRVRAVRQNGGQDAAGRRPGVVIDVIDNGPGVTEQARGKLFEAFQGTTRPGGSGLGLAIAAELAHLHGGEITLEEAPDGAHFRISIPDRAA